jgi:hypothetical protein
MEHCGAVTGIGSLPHCDPRAAAAFSFDECPDLPFVPHIAPDGVGTVASRSIVQGLVGVRGVGFDPERGLRVDVERLHPLAKVVPDLEHPSFAGLRAFLDEAVARRYTGPVKWQFAGPLTLGLGLMHRGVPARTAFDVAVRAVRVTTRAMYRAIDEALPGSHQVVLLDEPSAAGVLEPGFPVPPDTAIDLVSGALAALELSAEVGVHCCGNADLSAIIASGPGVLSIPVHEPGAGLATNLGQFLELGGVVAWGVVPVHGPLGSADRYWRELQALWGQMEAAGCEPERLRAQSLITPVCGLALHEPAQASAVFAICRAISERVRLSVDTTSAGMKVR